MCGPVAGRVADRFQAYRAELSVCAILAATAALLYLAAHEFWTVMAVSLLQAAALAPLVPLADALSLAHARPRQNTGGFEYGWVRGSGLGRSSWARFWPGRRQVAMASQRSSG